MTPTLYCTFVVDGMELTETFESVPKTDDYASIFPDAKEIRLARFWRGEANANDRRQGVAKWPILSSSCGIHPSQIAEARKAHPNQEFTPDGRMIFRSAAHKRQCMKQIGRVDANSYF
jgi:hypothetical protein